MEEGPPRKKAKSLAEKDPIKKDLATLPDDILIQIFSYLDLKSINNCAMLCSTLNNISKYSTLYKKIQLKCNMNSHFLKSLISKATCPNELYIEYNYFDQNAEAQDYSEFNKYVIMFLKKSGEKLRALKVESCKNNDVLLTLSECTNLERLSLYRSKGSVETLPLLRNLKSIKFIQCQFPQKIVVDVIRNNGNLRNVVLGDNNVNVNEVCEIMSQHNLQVTNIYLSERKKIKAKSLRTLARLSNLKSLEIISISKSVSDPEDSLEQLAAGCSKLEKLSIYGWKELNDDNFIPALHMFTQLTELDLRGINITVKSCREAALTLPRLKLMDVIKCHRVKKAQLARLQDEFKEIQIPLE